jgi:Icc-related predicted phosphoesterase
MKLQLFSDLHADVMPVKPIRVAEGVEAVIVAGDTCEGALRAFAQLRRIVPIEIPILGVLGNHEYYRRFVPDELALARSQAPSFNIHLLENDTTVLGGVRFVGATFWTDYKIFGAANQARVMSACASGMNDHRRIGWRKVLWMRFRPQEAALLHHRSRIYLEDILAVPFSGPSVVVTHHAVHWDSVHPSLRHELLTAAYVSDLSALIEARRPDLWVHGHVHHSADYRVGNTRVVCNPHGYGHENPEFNGALVIDVGT